MNTRRIAALISIVSLLGAMTSCNDNAVYDYSQLSPDEITLPPAAVMETSATEAVTVTIVEEDLLSELNGAAEAKPEFYPADEVVEFSISPAEIDGVWYLSNDMTNVLTVKVNPEDQSAEWEYSSGDESYRRGSVRIEYSRARNGDYEFWYNFYDEYDFLWETFKRDGVLPVKDLVAYQYGNPHFVREMPEQVINERTAIRTIAGNWLPEDSYDGVWIKITEEGSYTAFYPDGTVKNEGEVRYVVDESEDPVSFWFMLYKESGSYFTGFKDDGSDIKNDLYAGSYGEPHYVRVSDDGLLADGREPGEQDSDEYDDTEE